MRYSRLSLNLSLNISSHFRVLFQWYSYYSWKHSTFSYWNSHRRINNFASQTASVGYIDGGDNVMLSHWCWWLYDGDILKMLVTESLSWRFFHYVGDFLNVWNWLKTSHNFHQYISFSNIRYQHQCSRYNDICRFSLKYIHF